LLELLQKLGYFPQTAVWELTLQCNLNCRHCGSKAGKKRDDELTKDELFSLADELVDLGLEKVTLSGGEPTMNPLWDKIGGHLVKQGVQVNIISNGILWDKDYAMKAKDAGFRSAAFSLDGFEDSHDYIRGVKGSFTKVLKAFDACRSVDLPISAVTTIYRRNLKEIEKLKEFLHEEQVRSWQLQIGTPAGNMKENMELVIEPEDLLEIVPLLAKLRKQKSRPVVYIGDNIGYFGPYEEDLRGTGKEIDFWLGCRAGLQVIGIESNGNIKGCLSLPSKLNNEDMFIEGNIRKTSVTDIWCDPDKFSYNRQFTADLLDGFCHTCTYNEICRGGCKWSSFSNTGGKFDNPFCYYRVAVEKGIIEPD
jgi:radical SAM protein with 4Fe4S-binding SPASM domain